jgi:hypothetical protein
MAIITLTTDFGGQDAYAGIMHGVILAINPEARLVDLTHDIPAGDIRSGAFCLYSAAPFFPPGTIHVAVVDPGVGGDREALAIRTRRAIYLGPDNGLLSWAVRAGEVLEIRRLGRRSLWLPEISRTFHGRDILAPVAAHLSRGKAFGQVGERRATFIRLTWPAVEQTERAASGEVIHVDRFGNATTNLEGALFRQPPWSRATFHVRGRSLGTLQTHYQAAANGCPVVVIGSTGHAEIAVSQGSAAKVLGLKAGTRVTARVSL